MREPKAVTYYKKAFGNMKKCLRDAQAKGHQNAKYTFKLKNLKTGEFEDVMRVDLAIDWCIKYYLPELSSNTWRLYRLGYLLILNRYANKLNISTEEVKKIEDKVYTLHGVPKAERQKKTTAKRKKTIKQEEIEKIEEYLSRRQRKWGEALVIWLKASIITGLRPNEWVTAEIIEKDNKIILKTDNFKYNEQRSYSPFRELDISNFTEDMLFIVKTQLAIVNQMKELQLTEEHYRGCVDLLYKVNKAIWSKRVYNITLYTGRHQFSSNMKKVATEVERAALMGHKTTVTSREKYGKRRSGNVCLVPTVSNKDVLSLIKNPDISSFVIDQKQKNKVT